MRHIPPIVYGLLALCTLGTGGSSTANLTWLEIDGGYQFPRRNGSGDRGLAYSDSLVPTLERQLLQLKMETMSESSAYEDVLYKKHGNKGDGSGRRGAPPQRLLVSEAAGAHLELGYLGVPAMTPGLARRDVEGAPVPLDNGGCCHSPAQDMAGDFVRQLVNYASARAADDVTYLLQWAASSPKKWSEMRHMLRKLDDELAAYGDENNGPNISTAPVQSRGSLYSSKSSGRRKGKERKKKGVKKKPRHKEKVKIKANVTRELYPRQEEPRTWNVLPLGTNRSGKILGGKGRAKKVLVRQRFGTSRQDNLMRYEFDAAESPEGLSPIDELLHALLAADTTGTDVAKSTSHQETETLSNSTTPTDVNPTESLHLQGREVSRNGTSRDMEKVSFVKYEKIEPIYNQIHIINNHTGDEHSSQEKSTKSPNNRLQKAKTATDENIFLRNVVKNLKNWRPHLDVRPSDDDWPSFKSSRGDEERRASTTAAAADHELPATASGRPGGGGDARRPSPTTAYPAVHHRHGSPMRRLFVYHRVTTSPRLRAPPHSAFVAVSVVSPTAPGRRKAFRRAATTPAPAVPGDDLERQLMDLAGSGSQTLSQTFPDGEAQELTGKSAINKHQLEQRKSFLEHLHVATTSVSPALLNVRGSNL